jgi:hypothetical protein
MNRHTLFSWCDRSATCRNPIQRPSDVENYFCFLRDDLSINFHPDDDMADVINYVTGEPSFSELEAKWHNLLMATCHSVCNLEDVDLYGIACELEKIRECYEQAESFLGKMVIAKNVVENYPFVWCEKGALAKVIKVEDGYVYVQLVEHHKDLDEWDNCVMYYDEVNNLNSTDFIRDWELTDIHSYTYAITVIGYDEGRELSDDEKEDRICENLEEVRQFIDNRFPDEKYEWRWGNDDNADLSIGHIMGDKWVTDIEVERIPRDKDGNITGQNPVCAKHLCPLIIKEGLYVCPICKPDYSNPKCDRCGETLEEGDIRTDENQEEYYKCSSCHFMCHSDDYYGNSSHGLCPVCNESAPCKHHPKKADRTIIEDADEVDWSLWLPPVMEMSKDKQDMILGFVARLRSDDGEYSKLSSADFSVGRQGDMVIVSDGKVSTLLSGHSEYMDSVEFVLGYGVRKGLLHSYNTRCD